MLHISWFQWHLEKIPLCQHRVYKQNFFFFKDIICHWNFMPVGRLFLSYISCNVRSHGQIHENLPLLMLSLFCISRNFLASDFSSHWDPDRAEESFEVWSQWLCCGNQRRDDKGTESMPSGVMGLLVWVSSAGGKYAGNKSALYRTRFHSPLMSVTKSSRLREE